MIIEGFQKENTYIEFLNYSTRSVFFKAKYVHAQTLTLTDIKIKPLTLH